jgi:hypothetical protein
VLVPFYKGRVPSDGLAGPLEEHMPIIPSPVIRAGVSAPPGVDEKERIFFSEQPQVPDPGE